MTAPTLRSDALALDGDAFRRIGHDLVDRLAAHFDGLRDRPVTAGEAPDVVRELLGSRGGLPDHGTAPDEIASEAAQLLLDHSLFNAHPRFMGYITASPAPLGVLADLLASGVNANVGAWALSPMATEMEEQAVRWIAEMLGMPEGTGGLMVSGGNMANMVALWAARTAVGARYGVREKGMAALPGRLCIYTSAETHTWVQRGADLAGLGADAVRWIETDDGFRMKVEAVRAAIREDRARGDIPMMVVGTGGSVGTGAVDPLAELSELCREEGVWFHVDGAYGGVAVVSPEAPDELRALSLADSVAVDPHKWLYAPLEAGCVLARDPETLRAAYSYHPSFFHFGGEVTNFYDLGPQNSRGFRALKVWMQLRQAGRAGYAALIGEDMALARRLAERVAETPELEGGPAGLSIATFRYVPPELADRIGEPSVEPRLEALNREIQARMERGGQAFVSNAVLRGRYFLRGCIVNLNTRAEDVDAIPAVTVELGRAVWREAGLWREEDAAA